jgi:hypothetical protein
VLSESLVQISGKNNVNKMDSAGVTGTVGHHGGVYFELVIVKDDVSPIT